VHDSFEFRVTNIHIVKGMCFGGGFQSYVCRNFNIFRTNEVGPRQQVKPIKISSLAAPCSNFENKAVSSTNRSNAQQQRQAKRNYLSSRTYFVFRLLCSYTDGTSKQKCAAIARHFGWRGPAPKLLEVGSSVLRVHDGSSVCKRTQVITETN
jgi:hypothetical protein